MEPSNWPRHWRLAGAEIVPGDPAGPRLAGDLEVRDGRIAALGHDLPPADADTLVISRPGHLVLPGFIQSHLHLCQSLFRGLAEERTLQAWLGERILPLEAAHNADTVAAAARLGIAEALREGATTIVDMGTVQHNDAIAAAAAEMGVRAVLGKALMDIGQGAPPGLCQSAEVALSEALALHARWHGAADGRLQVALAPRFTPSVSAPLWEGIAAAAREQDLLVHTHVSETPWENGICRRLHGDTPVRLLARWGVLAARTLLVHAIWLDEEERELLAAHPAAVVHCPGSNAKLGSGICDLVALRTAGIPVGLGSDGAACNDEVRMLSEMRLAAQLQNLRHGPDRVGAAEVLRMATSEGARAAGLDAEVGRLEVGKRADFILFDLRDCGWDADSETAHRLIFAASGTRPTDVFVDGRPLIWEGRFCGAPLEELRSAATEARRNLLERVERGKGAWKYRGN